MKALKQFQTPAGRMYMPGDKIDDGIDAPTVRHYIKHGMVSDAAEKVEAKKEAVKAVAGK